MPGPLPNVPKVVRVDFKHTYGADADVQCRSFFQYTGALSLADALAWANAIATSWHGHVMALMSTGLVLVQTTLTDLSSPTAPQVISLVTGAGGDAQPTLSGGSAVVMKHKIARRYRGGHPRTYIPGLTAPNMTSPQNISAVFIGLMNTAFAAYVSDALTGVPVAAAPATQVSVSFFAGFTAITVPGHRPKVVPNLRVGGPQVDPILSNLCNPRIGSQRRRDSQGA